MTGHGDPEFSRPLAESDVDFLDEFAPELDAGGPGEEARVDAVHTPAPVAPPAGDQATRSPIVTIGEEMSSNRAWRVYVGGVAAVVALASYLALFRVPARSTDVAETSSIGRATTAVTTTLGVLTEEYPAPRLQDPSYTAAETPPDTTLSVTTAVGRESTTATNARPRGSHTGHRRAPEPPRSAQAKPPDSADELNGLWALINHVETTSYRRYEGLRLGYRLQLTQDGNRVSGSGHKWTEGERQIPRAGRTPIRVAGMREGRRIALTFTERGSRRTSGGTFELELTNDGMLSGRFKSDAANARGSSVARRVSSAPTTTQ